MRVGRLEIEPLIGTRVWIGTDSLYADGQVVVRLSPIADEYLYGEARLVSELISAAPFKLVNIFADDRLGVAGYVLLVPGPVAPLEDVLTIRDPVSIARSLARALLILHESGIAYRNFGTGAFVLAGEHAVPCDYSRATRLSGDSGGLVSPVTAGEDIAEEYRTPTQFDPPEAAREEYEGVPADIFGLGVLLKQIGLDRLSHGDLITAMTQADAARRPASVRLVLDQL